VSTYLTVADVADELEVSARTVLRWVERGELQAVRLPGGRLRISQAELAARLEQWSTTSTGDGRMLAASIEQEANSADR
jgi:excisionase family DNA binding protein